MNRIPSLALKTIETRDDAEVIALRDAGELFLAEMHGDRPPRWLTLLGQSGVGKTHTARAMYALAKKRLGFQLCPRLGIEQFRTFRFFNWTEACGRMRDGEHDLVKAMRAVDLLVLDDIGAEYDPSGYVTSQLYRVIDGRMGKWTILTSNLTLAQINDTLDQRIADRMLRDGNKVQTVEAKSWAMR